MLDRNARDTLVQQRDQERDEKRSMDTPRPLALAKVRKRPRARPYLSSDSHSDPPPEFQHGKLSDDDLSEAFLFNSEHVSTRRWSLPEAGRVVGEEVNVVREEVSRIFTEKLTIPTRRHSRCNSEDITLFSSVNHNHHFSRRTASGLAPEIPSSASLSASSASAPCLAGVQTEHVQLIYHMLRHAESIYGFPISMPSAPGVVLTKVTDRGIICRRTGLSSADLKVGAFSTTAFMPGHYVAVDRQIKAVIVCVRGTANLVDSLTDVAATQDPMRMRREAPCSDFSLSDADDDVIEGHGHAGVLRSARNLFHRIRDTVLVAIRENPGFELMVTGHSLGGATAAVLALIMRDDPEFPRALAFAFAPLPCLTYDLAELTASFTITVINGPDIVPRLSVAMLLPYFATARYVADLSRSRKVLLALGLKGAAINWDDLEEFSANRVKELSKEHEGRRLYIPGKVFQLVRKNEVRKKDAVRNKMFRRRDVEVVAVRRTQFLQVRGRERGMFVSHAPFTYKNSLLTALKSMGAQPLKKMTGGSVFRNLLTVPVSGFLSKSRKTRGEESLDGLLKRIGEDSPLTE